MKQEYCTVKERVSQNVTLAYGYFDHPVEKNATINLDPSWRVTKHHTRKLRTPRIARQVYHTCKYKRTEMSSFADSYARA